MESNYEKLRQYLTNFLTALKDTGSDLSGNKTDASAPPRMELIDFDELGAVLRETITELEAARTQERERTIVRQWFIDRIVSLNRGRQAILGTPGSLNDAASDNAAPLPELMRRFEEVSARLRSTAANHHSSRIGNAYRKADSFKPFKS